MKASCCIRVVGLLLTLRHCCYRPVEAWLRDAHDNNWLLLEAALAVPFVVGYRTAAGGPVLAASMLKAILTGFGAKLYIPCPTRLTNALNEREDTIQHC